MLLQNDQFTIEIIDEVQHQFLEELKTSSDVFELDLSNVNKIDLPSIQLILSLQKSLHLQNKKLSIINCNLPVKNAFILCGCANILGLSNE